MVSVKELAKWLKEEVEFLKENQEYVGGWYDLDGVLAATVLWEEGWGDEPRDDVIQATDNPDWGLCAGIMLMNLDDTPDGWFMPWDSKTGDIICETTGIEPNEDYEKLAQFLLDDYNYVKDAEIKPNGETIFPEEKVEEPELDVEEESMKEDFTDLGVKVLKKFNELGLGKFYDPFAGSCGPFTKNGYEEFKDKMNIICDEFDDFAIIKDFTNVYQDQDACDGKDKVVELGEEPVELYWVTSLLDGVEDEDFIRKPRVEVEESLKESEEDKLIAMIKDDKVSVDDCMHEYLTIYEDTDVMTSFDMEETIRDLNKGNEEDIEQAKRLEKLLDDNPGVDYFDYYNEEPITDKKWIIDRLEVEESLKEEKTMIKEEKQTLKESKEFSTSPYKDIIAEHFDYSGDFEFLDVIASILSRVDDFTSDEDIYSAIDDELIYTYDQWKVLEYYCTPQDANWEVASESLTGDVFSICATIADSANEEEPEEDIELETTNEVDIEDVDDDMEIANED